LAGCGAGGCRIPQHPCLPAQASRSYPLKDRGAGKVLRGCLQACGIRRTSARRDGGSSSPDRLSNALANASSVGKRAAREVCDLQEIGTSPSSRREDSSFAARFPVRRTDSSLSPQKRGALAEMPTPLTTLSLFIVSAEKHLERSSPLAPPSRGVGCLHTAKWGPRRGKRPGPVAPRAVTLSAPDTLANAVAVPFSSEPGPRSTRPKGARVSRYIECNWCGQDLYGRDYAGLPVTIKRRRASRLDAAWAEERRSALHFCVAPDDSEERNRMGLPRSDEKDAESCLTRALAMIEGTGTATPNMGLEWRLVPAGAVISEASDERVAEVVHDEGAMAEPLWVFDHPAMRGCGGESRRWFNHELEARGLNLTDCPTSFNIYRLRDDGYETVGDLYRSIQDESLLKVRGVGLKTLRWMKDKVDAFLASESAAVPRRVAAGGAR
jgi:hypothetical protein